MNVCGIDPGLSGALAVLNESGVVLVEDLPIYQLPGSKRLRAELDLATLRQMLCARAIDQPQRDGGRADAILIAHGLRLHASTPGDCRRMSTTASPPSMLPNPQPASEPVHVVRLRLRSEMELRRQTKRENLRRRTEIARLQSLLRRRACRLH
jgi:hypothetical protein